MRRSAKVEGNEILASAGISPRSYREIGFAVEGGKEGGEAGGVGVKGLGRGLKRVNVEEWELEKLVVVGVNGGGVAEVGECKEHNKEHRGFRDEER